MKQFKVSYYFENDEDEIDFVTLDFDSEIEKWYEYESLDINEFIKHYYTA